MLFENKYAAYLYMSHLHLAVPSDLNQTLQHYTGEGYRVIALAHRPLANSTSWDSIHNSRREEMECDLIFLGLLVLQNRLKPESASTIASMHHADIRTVMVTGEYSMN